VWDVFAVGTYLTVSIIFWYVGLLPDVATMRDRAISKRVQMIYGILALGWRGSARHWKRFHIAYLLLAGLATPLVLSVHSVVSMDFAIAIVPGWHSTIFPPYFVAGAIFSGFAMVLTLAIPIRKFYRLEDFITIRHLENCAKIMLATGLMVAHGYITEGFMSWYSDDKFEIYLTLNRMFGPYAPAYWLLIFCNVGVNQLLWFKKIRTNPAALFVVALFIQVGMWTERYVIVITSLHRDFLPSAWGIFHGTRWDWMTLIGSLGLFASLFFLFLRLLPAISISEMRDLVHEKSESAR
jgi:Ni/Fe-hydrogenase subunit HybB-like protein